MTPNPNPSPELPKCRYCGGAGKFQVVSSVSDGAWATCFCSRAALSQTLPAPGEVEELAQSVIAIPWFRHSPDHPDGRMVASDLPDRLALATVAAANDEGVALDWRAIAKLAGEHGVRYRTNTALEKFLAAIRLLSQGGGKAERYRHVKRGSVYEIVGRAELQVNNIALTDGVTMVVYRGEDGKLWVRGEAEFMDGRFEPLATSRSQHEGASS